MARLATPDVEGDIVQLLKAAFPADLRVDPDLNPNTWSGPLRPTTDVGIEVFVSEFGGITDVDNDGRHRIFRVQVTVRGASNEYAAGLAFAKRVHDVLDQHAAFTGTSGARYHQVMAQLAGPNHLGPDDEDQDVFGEPFDVWFDG